MTTQAETAPAAAPATPPTAAPAASESPTTNLGARFAGDPAWQRAVEAVKNMSQAPAEEVAPLEDAPAGDATAAEAAPAATPAPAKELESDKWVEARRARIRAEREAAKRSQALEAEKATYQAKASELDSFAKAKELIGKGQLHAAAEMLGIKYEDLTAEVIRGPKGEDPTEALRKEIEEVKAWKAEMAAAKAAEERDAAERGAISVVRAELAEAPEFALLRKHADWEREVLQLMTIRWEQAGWAGSEPPISAADAARELTGYLKEQRRAELSAVAEADPDLLRELGFARANETKQPPAHEANRATTNAAPTAPRTLSGAHEGEAGRLVEANDHAEFRRRAILRAQQLLQTKE